MWSASRCPPRPRLARAFGLVLLVTAACKGDPTGVLPSSVGASGSQNTMGGSMSPAGAATVNVAIGDFSFAPATITVRVGTTVRWTNNGPSTHTVMNDAGSWASSPLVPPAMTGMGMGYGMDGMDGMGGMSSGTMGMGSGGGAFQFTFTHPGTFPYHCALHPPAKYPGFVGLVTVTP